MRRGAPPAGCTGWGSGAPPFYASVFFDSAPHASPAHPLLMLPLEHMISHVFTGALT